MGKLTARDIEFGIWVDVQVQLLCFFQGMRAMAAMRQAPPRPYAATDKSGAKTRQSLGALGIRAPGPRSRRPTADERARAEAAKWGTLAA